jgi:hypothetical protein
MSTYEIRKEAPIEDADAMKVRMKEWQILVPLFDVLVRKTFIGFA